MQKITLGVIFGGKSPEHDVSVISAVECMNQINRDKYTVIPIYIDRNNTWFTGEALRSLYTFDPFDANKEGIYPCAPDINGSGKLITYPITKRKHLQCFGGKPKMDTLDCVCIVMHGAYGEDGSLQGLLEMANIPYTSTGVPGSAIGMDKIMMKQFFRGAELPILDSVWLTRKEFEKDRDAACNKVEKALDYPVFVKPANLGSSIGVTKAKDTNALIEALTLAFMLDRRVMVEAGVEKPIEVNCAVIGYDDECEASEVELIQTDGNILTIERKYGEKTVKPYEHVIPAPIDESLRDRIQSLSADIFRMMDCKGVIRIDYMIDPENQALYITEVNTIPGSLAHYLWVNLGKPYHTLIDMMVKDALKAHNDKKRNTFIHANAIISNTLWGIHKGGKGKINRK